VHLPDTHLCAHITDKMTAKSNLIVTRARAAVQCPSHLTSAYNMAWHFCYYNNDYYFSFCFTCLLFWSYSGL